MTSSHPSGATIETSASSGRFADYGLVGVLILLCVACSVATIEKRKPTGNEAAQIVAEEILAGQIGAPDDPQRQIVIVAGDAKFADALEENLKGQKPPPVKITGKTPAMRKALEARIATGEPIDLIATTRVDKLIVDDVKQNFTTLGETEIIFADEYWRSTFLSKSNLLSVAKKNVVIAVIALGMTLVIITGGIDLSVGSLVALAAVVAAVLIEAAGAKQATTLAMIGCSLAAVAVCAGWGTFSGTMVTVFKVPPFVATLAMMWVASGLAYIISDGETVSELPDSYNWLGMQSTGVPSLVLLLAALAGIATIVACRGTPRQGATLADEDTPPPKKLGPMAMLAIIGLAIVCVPLVLSMTSGTFTVEIPNTLILVGVLYAVGHLVMSRTQLGRHIYAIGGNRTAARLSGVRINRVLLIVYTISGALAGVGGVMLASEFTGGAARYGRMYELYAIAAVVVGGTSLAGGQGKVLGTLLGVLTIAVVQTAMNLLKIGSYQQQVVLGMILLLVVLLDLLKRRGWRALLAPE